MTQTEAIRKYLLSGRSLTPLEALSRFSCLRLSARVLDLRDTYGADSVRTEMVSINGKRVARYHGTGRLK